MELESAKANNPVTSQNALKQANNKSKSQESNSKSKSKSSAPQGGQAVAHQTAASAAPKSKDKRTCPFCKSADHCYVSKCQKFRDLSVDERWKTVQANRLCHRCLGINHQQSTCVKDWKCSKCQKQNHNTPRHWGHSSV